MNDAKYIGMDVHRESISIAVLNSAGKIVLECVVETKASIILQFIDGLRGELHVTFEEGTWAAWLYDLLKPHVTRIVVCDPRKNASMKEGNKSDKIDARRLAELLRLDHLSPVYHGEHGLRSLKELVRSYLTISKDLGRVMTRVKAIYRSWAIPCTGKQVYAPQHRAECWGTSLHRWRILTTIAPHPVQPNRQPASHRYLGNASVATHRQVNVPTSPVRMNARRCLGCFHQQEAQQGTALLADMSKSLLASTGRLTRDHPHVRADLLAALKPRRCSDDQHVGECGKRSDAGMRHQPHRLRPLSGFPFEGYG